MKDYLNEIVDQNLDNQTNKNRIREYIQKYFLYILYKKKIYRNLVFTGGTALRFLHKIKRFSEDLDFSLSVKAENYNFIDLLDKTKKEFELAGYNLEVKYNEEKNVNSAFFKFSQLLFEYGVSPLKEEKVSIKLEIDTNPPSGGKEEVDLYNAIFMFDILHYDLSSLFTGKVHALLFRKYVKGRDWYDLVWYLTNFKKLEPNFEMLNNAARQTLGEDFDKELKIENWKSILSKKVETIDVAKIKNDVYRFLESHSDVELLTKDNLIKLLKQ